MPPSAETADVPATTAPFMFPPITTEPFVDRASTIKGPGLHVVFDSFRDNKPPCIAEIDVVAIHGLNFKGNPHHAQETWTKSGKLWPKDFLPEYLPKPARVMLFAYNSSPAIGAAAIKLDDHAKSLLQWLWLKRKGAEKRPLVFIGHSLGGLVVKEALVEATLNEKYKSIIEATRLLVFFATPHQGGNYASIGDIVARIVVMGGLNNDLLKAPKQSSNEAIRRFEQARHVFERCLVVSFFEGEPYGKMGIIVDKKSATMNLPGSQETQVAIEADHSTICKFDSASDPICQLVLGTIAAEVERALKKVQHFYDCDSPIIREADNSCLRDLWVTNPRDDKVRIEQRKGGLLRASYTWILSHYDFQKLLSDPNSRLLWVKGDPGKGKTMLLCGIIDELSSTEQKTALSYFFCESADMSLNSATSVLRGLIYMLVDQQPALISHVQKRHGQAGGQLFNDKNAWAVLSNILHDILGDPYLQSAYIIVDALDECIADQGILVDFIVRESAMHSSIKWIISSRNLLSVERALRDVAQKTSSSIELNEKSISSAVTVYVQSKVDWLAKRNCYDSDTYRTVQQYLLSNADNTFLWVSLACIGLSDVSGWQVEDCLTDFPPGLEAIYRRMLNGICRSTKAKLYVSILALISVVYRPISLDELDSLVDLPSPSLGRDHVISEIIRLCGSFLTIRERTIFFVHQSAKEFLIENASLETFPSGIGHIHRTIFSRSLQVLSRLLKRNVYGLVSPGQAIDQVKTPYPDPLAAARYSCVYWARHFCDHSTSKHAEGGFQDQDGISIEKFLCQDYLHWLEALSLLKCVSEGLASMLRLERLVLVGGSRQLLARVRDARRFALYHKWGYENSPLQLYSSAVIFSPAKSITRLQFEFETNEPGWIIRKPHMQDRWSACLQTLEGHGDAVVSVAWSHDATRFASASNDRTIKVWNPANGQCSSTLNGHDDWVTSLAWAPSAEQLVSVSWDGIIKIWDVETSLCLRTLTSHTDSDNRVACVENALWIISIPLQQGNMIKIWNLATDTCVHTLQGHSTQVKSLALSNDATRLASSSDGTIKIWDLATDICMYTLDGHEKQVNSLAWSYDTFRLASSSDEDIKIWDLATHTRALTIKGQKRVNSVAWSNDTRRLASASDRVIKIWDLETNTCIRTFSGHRDVVSTVSWPYYTANLVSTSEDKTIKIWDPDGDSSAVMPESHSSMVSLVVWSKDATSLASVSNKTIEIWHQPSGSSTRTLVGHIHQINSIAWSYDAKRLASGSNDGTIKIWDPSAGNCIHTLNGHGDRVNAVAWSFDMRCLASASSDKTIRIWDPVTGQCLQTLKGHNDWVTCLSWSPDTSQLASASYDEIIKIWSLATSQCWSTFESYDGNIVSLAWSYDATVLASSDETIKIWDVKSGQCIDIIETGQVPHHLHFEESNSNHLRTEFGTLDLQYCKTSNSPTDSSYTTRYVGYGLDSQGTWITYKGQKLLWLPPEYRPSSCAVIGTNFAIGCSSGSVLILNFSSLGPVS